MKLVEDKESVIHQITKFIHNSKSQICICAETTSNFLNINTGIFQEFKDFHTRGGKIKYITEINQESSSDCDKILQLCDLRHLDNSSGNFAINDKGEYITTTFIQKETGIMNILYSDSKEFHDKQQILFENLWNRSTNGQEKIKELEHKINREKLIPKTAIPTYVSERIVENKINNLIKNSKWISICCDINWLNKIRPKIYDNILKATDTYSERSKVQKANLDFDDKGHESNRKSDLLWNSQTNKVRWLSPINTENKKLIIKNLDKGIEFRNIEINPINFIVSDKYCMFAIESLDGKPNQSRVFFSDDKIYLGHFNNLFERLWIIGQNAVDRIKENHELQERREKRIIESSQEGKQQDENNNTIDSGVELKKTEEKLNVQREITEIIHNSEEFAKRMLQMTERTREDVMLILASSNAFNQSLSYGAFDIFNRIVKEKAIDMRILISSPVSAESEVELDAEQRRKELKEVNKIKKYVLNIMPSVKFELIDKKNYYKEAEGMSILVIDHQEVLCWEVNKDAIDNTREATRLALYSNSRPLVLSYNSIFESLWNNTQLYNDLKEANKKIELSEKLQKEFIDITAHELRTPTQAIMGYSEMGIDTSDQKSTKTTSTEHDKLFETINRNANRINRLLEDFINVTRIENNLLTLVPENTSIYNLVKDTINEFNDISNINNREDSKTKIKINFEEPNFEIDPIVNIDRTKIYQVISNLLSNALKSTPSNKEIIVSMEIGEEPEYSANNIIPINGSGKNNEIYNNKSSNKDKVLDDIKEKYDKLRLPQRNTNESDENIDRTENVKPKTTRKRKLVIIKIKDKGKGIDEKIYPKLFEKFATGDNNNTGLGLGLYISKWILDFHKGKIWAENNKDESGATFSISLPLKNQ
jgi:signal transduction histidine kinase